jgi:hypothetical protein
VADWGWMWPDVPLNCTDSRWPWSGGARHVSLLAPRLAPDARAPASPATRGGPARALRLTPQAQHDHAAAHSQEHRGQMFASLLARIGQDAS